MEHKVYMNYIHPSSLLRQLSDLWKADQMCDAVLTVDNLIVAKAHKVVLLAISPKLKLDSSISTPSPILDVCLPTGVNHRAVHAFLQYIYEGFLILTKTLAEDLIKIAKYLEIKCLCSCCSDFLDSFVGDAVVLSVDGQTDNTKSDDFCHVRKSKVVEVKSEQLEEADSETAEIRKSKRRCSETVSKRVSYSSVQGIEDNFQRQSIESDDGFTDRDSGARNIQGMTVQEDGEESGNKSGSGRKRKSERRKISLDVETPFSSSISHSSPSHNSSANLETMALGRSLESSRQLDGIGDKQTDFFVQNVRSGEIVMSEDDKSCERSEFDRLGVVEVKQEQLDSCEAWPVECGAGDGPARSSTGDARSELKDLGCSPIEGSGVTVEVESPTPSNDVGASSLESGASKRRHTDAIASTSKYVDQDGCCEQRVKRRLKHKLETTLAGIHVHYKCSESSCQLTFSSRNSLIRHKKKHDGCLLSCPACPRRFYDKNDLNQHTRSVHMGVKYPCKYTDCPKSFMTKAGLKKHVCAHEDKFKYKCQICEKGFNYLTEFTDHVNRHNGLRPHRCTKCDADFAHERSYRFHMQICGKVQDPIKCDICGSEFKDKKYLKEHMHCHTSPRKYQCCRCGKEFSHRGSLSTHENRKH